MTTAKEFVSALLLDLCTVLTALLPCFTDAEDFKRSLDAPWFEEDVETALEYFKQLELVVHGRRRRGSALLPRRLKGLMWLEGDSDLRRVVRYGQRLDVYLREAWMSKGALEREMPTADATDRDYALNYATTPREELDEHIVEFEGRGKKRSLVFWVLDVERTMRGCRVAVAKIKNAASDWFWDERAGKATIVSDGVESNVVYTPHKRKRGPAQQSAEGRDCKRRRL